MKESVREYQFTPPEEERENITALNVCRWNNIESGLPKEEQGMQEIEKDKTLALYTDALKRGDAWPVFVGMPHAGELIPDALVPRIERPKGFIEGLDHGTAHIFSPKQGDKYVAARNRVSRLVADPNRGPRQFEAGPRAIGGVMWKLDLQNQPIYKKDQEPTEAEMADFVDMAYRPYERGLHSLVASLYEKIGYEEIVFFDGHAFPGNVAIPKYNLSAKDPKPLFIIGTKDNTSAAKELTVIFQKALTDNTPSRKELPELFKDISDVVALNAPFKGVRNVEYWGEPEGISKGVSGEKMPYKIHAIQLEVNSSSFLKDGKYNRENLEKIRVAVQKAIKAVAEEVQRRHKV